MAVKKSVPKNSENKSSKNNSGTKSTKLSEGGRKFLFAAAIFLIIALCALIAWLVYVIPQKLMNDNPRFALKQVNVVSPGYWSGKGDEVLTKLELKKGMSIFQINVGAVREKALQNIDNIKDAEVSLVLPDMIVFNLTERIPRAELGNGQFVIDEDGKMFKRSESMAADRKGSLPKLIMKSNGNKNLQLEAVKLIMTANSECPDIVIKSIVIDSSYEFKVVLTHRNGQDLQVVFPIGGESYSTLFNKLQNAILHTALKGENPVGFDLRSKNYAIPKYK